MTQQYDNILVAVDGSDGATLAFKKAIAISLRNQAKLTIAHVVDTRTLQSINSFDTDVYDQLQEDAEKLLLSYKEEALAAGVHSVQTVLEFGNPKTILATEIPDREKIDLIMVGATGLNAFERLLIGSSSEYILRHAKVDLLIVRDQEKIF